MLPPFLVDLELDELKGLCLEQLIGMSKKRISCVLAGQEMVESSDTDDDSDANTDDTDIGDNGRVSAMVVYLQNLENKLGIKVGMMKS